MNCKLGELVRYVGQNKYKRPNVFGWIGKIVGVPDQIFPGEHTWIVDPPLPGGIRFLPGWWSDGAWIADSNLRPIRPGESPEESAEAMRRITSIQSEVTA